MSASTDVVLLETTDTVATITLNRPDSLNAMSPALLDRLTDVTEEVVSNESLRVVVLTGAGRGFCAGGDLSSMSDGEFRSGGPVQREVRTLEEHARVSRLLRGSAAVTVAAINGPCAGAGLSLAAACDLRVASDKAVFKTAFLSAGLSGDFGGTWFLSRLLGEARAKELFLLDEKLDAASALRIGLVSKVIAADAFREVVDEVVRGLAGRPPTALSGMKANLNASSLDLGEALAAESLRHIRSARALT